MRDCQYHQRSRPGAAVAQLRAGNVPPKPLGKEKKLFRTGSVGAGVSLRTNLIHLSLMIRLKPWWK